MSHLPRAILAEQQAQLVRALVANGPCPEGVDPGKVESIRKSLLRKRKKEVGEAWPILEHSRPDRWGREFLEYASQNPPPVGGPVEDGRRFLLQLSAKSSDSWMHLALAERDLVHPEKVCAWVFRKIPGTLKWVIGLSVRGRIRLLKLAP